MRANRKHLFLALLLAVCTLFVACGGGSKPNSIQALNVARTTPPTGFVGITYGFTFTATGGLQPYTWSVSAGALPDGLTLNTSSGAISGTPTNAATYSFTLMCTDSQKPTAAVATQNFTITVKPLTALAITTKTLTTANLNSFYSATLAATGGVTPYTWTVDSGSLPAGLTLSTAGVISGIPTAAGSSTFTVKVTDSQTTAKTATQVLTLTVNTPAPLVITTKTLTDAIINAPYTATLTATGGVAPYHWSLTAGTLPAGLTLGFGGVIAGTPTALGTSTFTVRVTDSQTNTASATQDLTLVVKNPEPLVITTTTLPDATIGLAYTATLTATGGVTPYAWTLDANSGPLPPGLSLSTAGVISGTPTAVGTTSFIVKVTDTEPVPQTTTATLSITVNNPPPLTITSTSPLPNATVNVAYTDTLTATGGIPPYTWTLTAGGLPAGLSLNSAGAITGTPTSTGPSNFTVQVTDSAPTPATASADFKLTVTTLGNGLLTGNFAFSFNGFDNSHGGTPVFYAGSLISDGAGNISSGVVDYVSSGNLPQNTTLTGSYTINDNGLGNMTLTAGNLGTLSLQLSAPLLGGPIRFIQNANSDGSGVYGSGTFKKQTPAAFSVSALGGNYVYGFSGVDNTGARMARMGLQTITNGAISAGTSDVNDAGALSSVTTPAGTYSDVDSTSGRGTVVFHDSNGDTNYVFYVVAATELVLLEDEKATPVPMVLGSLLKQTINNTGGATLSGNTVVELSGILSGPVPDIQIGRIVIPASSANFNLTSDENAGGTLSTPNCSGGSFVVTLGGRVSTSNCLQFSVLMYLNATDAGFVMSQDASVKFGYIEPQSSPGFSNGSILGTYLGGSLNPVLSTVTNESDSAVGDGNGNLTVTFDSSGPGGLVQGQTQTETYTLDGGGHMVISNNSIQTALGYAISGNKFVVMPTDAQPKLLSLQR